MEKNRLGVSGEIGETAMKLYNFTSYEYCHNPKFMKDIVLRTYEEFGLDDVGVGLGLQGLAEAFGSKVEYPEDSLKYVIEPKVKVVEDIKSLKIPNPLKDARLPLVLEGGEMLIDEFKGQKEIGLDIAGPMSVAVNLCGADNLFRWLRKHPASVHEMLEIITEANNLYIDEMVKIGLNVEFSDPMASTTVLSKKQSEEFALPYLSKNLDHYNKISSKKASLHICGKTSQIWDSIRKLNIKAFSVDNVEDLAQLKEEMGDVHHIVGNVPPVEVIKNGTKEDITKSIATCILKGYDSKMGYTIGAGCQIPVGTSAENLHAYFDTAKELGKLPIDVERLEEIVNR
ncbi:uroporphyrinogen decarboxylase family protein [Lagierella sp.]|uniref:uroporphyrinogen decarboxylase family protein n=1 Tax=Lagierella sp. TaxID=2849657 RepID=UPI00261F910C|nr:uroporphyrinogen decarboxylase family protein [Lagierella sp.]